MTGETVNRTEEGLPKMHPPQIYVERTLAIIKPDASDKAQEIEDIILKSGFTVLQKRRVQLTPEQASDFYVEHYGKLFFPSLVAYMSSAPITVMILARENAVNHWREMIGPTNAIKARETHPDCLRATYGRDDQRNAVHGSDSVATAQREIRFFFHDTVLEPMITRQLARDYMAKSVNPTLLRGLTQLCKVKPEDPVTWLADWLLDNNPNKPKVLQQYEVQEPSE